MSAFRLFAFAAAAVAIVACQPPVRPTPATLTFETIPESARVSIDARYAGLGRVLKIRPVRVKGGRHLISVEAEGYFPRDFESDFPPGEWNVRVELRPVPTLETRPAAQPHQADVNSISTR